MEPVLEEKLNHVRNVMAEVRQYEYAEAVLSFDQETICPSKGMEEQGEAAAYLGNQAFKLIKDEAFIEAAEYLYEHRGGLEEFDRVMAEQLHRDYLKTKNLSPELQHEFALVYNKAFVDWMEARGKSDYSLFAPSLQKVYEVGRKDISLREYDPEAVEKKIPYDTLLDDYERGMTSEMIDGIFEACKERLIPLLKKIMASKKVIRRDFLSRPVTDEQQRKMTEYLLKVLHFDLERGAWSTTEHPFTTGIGRNDVRVTTHFYPDMFYASLYSIIHEGGHALFDQNQPRENFDHFITEGKTLGMHESVSRFYENRLGRSKEFIHLIYPKVCEIFPNVMEGVSETELYEAMNIVEPSLIRTEADEFTYTFHIIIRYEIEKALFAGEVTVDDLPDLWRKKYREYLGIEPGTDREGILQDVHWTFGFGYFPTYAIGNFYNAMYYNRLKEEIDLPGALKAGDFKRINDWMAENVFAKADRLSPREWIRAITGRELTPDDFLDYLEEKYGEIYGIS